MTERPILFSAPMVRAILAGTKTQTRRVVKPVGNDGGFVLIEQESGAWWPYRDDGETSFVTVRQRGKDYLHEIPMSCPYGAPGDRLWVRETWLPDPPIDDTWASTQWSGCGRRISEVPDRFRHPRFCCYAADWLHGQIVWRPSIHMPRWASRITLEITGVRVEKLQDISEADAISEGAQPLLVPPDGGGAPHVEGFRQLWESINGGDSWDANPWVWVVEFKRVQGT